MRNLLVWTFGTAGAFFITAGAFLLLANLGSNASERSLNPKPPSLKTGLPLELKMDKDRLKSLRARPDQELSIVVNNRSEKDFSEVNLTLRVSSGDTSLSKSRYYQAKIKPLKAGTSKTARFLLDLSPISESPDQSVYPPENEEINQIILEAQATTPEGISSVKTAVLPLSDGNST